MDTQSWPIVKSFAGKIVGMITAPPSLFLDQPNTTAIQFVSNAIIKNSKLHRAAFYQSVSDVSKTTKKRYRQKGTGMARQGSYRSIHSKGGGVCFGFSRKEGKGQSSLRSKVGVNKKVRCLALRGALANRAQNNLLKFVDWSDIPHKCKDVVGVITQQVMNNPQYNKLLFVHGLSQRQWLSIRAIQNLRHVHASELNTNHILNHHYIVIDVSALPSLSKSLRSAISLSVQQEHKT